MSKKKMILDVDTGIDDAMAITYAVSDPNVDLIGVVADYGNIEAEGAARNTIQILDLLNVDVPVFIGATHPLTSNYKRLNVSSDIHGKNGIGDVKLPIPTKKVQNKNGIDFIIESAWKYKNELTIVPVGPLTNLALAIDKDPEIINLVKVTSMGGALTVPGNVTPVSEANIYQDPIAANRVYESGIDINMVGLDVTLRTLLTKKETQMWRNTETNAGNKMADIVDFYINIYDELYPELGGCSLHDPLAVGIAINPNFADFINLNMVVTCDDNPYYGRTIGDTSKLNEESNTKIAVNVNKDLYLKIFMEHFTSLFNSLK